MYEFWLEEPAGPVHLKRSFSASSSWTWNTAGWAPGAYLIQVWANSQGSDKSTWQALGSTTYTVN
jgi:hypothetical protein